VSDLKLLYQSGGVIDTFVNPNLVKNLMIRDYKKIGEFFEFSLDAEINLEDAVKQRNICG
jgi:hypothetical protein